MTTTRASSLVSLLASGSICLSLLIYPYLFGRELSGFQHGMLTLLLLCCSAGFVHGFGIRARGYLRFVFNGVVIWTAMALLLSLLLWG